MLLCWALWRLRRFDKVDGIEIARERKRESFVGPDRGAYTPEMSITCVCCVKCRSDLREWDVLGSG